MHIIQIDIGFSISPEINHKLLSQQVFFQHLWKFSCIMTYYTANIPSFYGKYNVQKLVVL